MGVQDSRSARLSRRQAMGLLGVGASVALVPGPWELLGSSLASAPGPAARAAKVTFPKGAIVRTLLKDVPPEALASGTTLFHEHLSIDLPQFGPRPADAPPIQPPPTHDVALIVEEVKAAATDGITCIVDGGHPDMKRRMENLREIADKTGVHIVASGGYYMERVYPPGLAAKSDDQIADDLTREANANRYGAFGEIGENPDAAMSGRAAPVVRSHRRENARRACVPADDFSVRAEAACGRRAGRDDSRHSGRQPAPVPRLRPEEVVVGRTRESDRCDRRPCPAASGARRPRRCCSARDTFPRRSRTPAQSANTARRPAVCS